MDITTEKPNRIAYKHLYLRYKALFFLALTAWLFTMGFLFSTARANIEYQRARMNHEIILGGK